MVSQYNWDVVIYETWLKADKSYIYFNWEKIMLDGELSRFIFWKESYLLILWKEQDWETQYNFIKSWGEEYMANEWIVSVLYNNDSDIFYIVTNNLENYESEYTIVKNWEEFNLWVDIYSWITSNRKWWIDFYTSDYVLYSCIR